MSFLGCRRLRVVACGRTVVFFGGVMCLGSAC